MDKYGFLRVATAIPHVSVANCTKNYEEIQKLCSDAYASSCEIVLFPELSVTGYTCGDLFNQRRLLDNAENSVSQLIKDSVEWKDMLVVVGAPVEVESSLYNCAITIQNGKILGISGKTHLPNYGEFYERRWFRPAPKETNDIEYAGQKGIPFSSRILYRCGKQVVFIEICEDLWTPIPPSSIASTKGANIILNMSASNEVIGKHDYLISLIKQQSARTQSAYIYASAGFGESSTDLVFAGNGIVCENGACLMESERFSYKSALHYCDVDVERIMSCRTRTSTFTEAVTNDMFTTVDFTQRDTEGRELSRFIDAFPFVPSEDEQLNKRCEEIVNIQTGGLMQRLDFTRCKSLVVGVSGGLDSTLALLIAVRAFDRLNLPRKGIFGITMPGFGTTDRTYNNAINLLDELGVSVKEICIADAVKQHFKDIEHDIANHDVTYENSQARERTQILMDYANKVGGMVLGTGDLSELALGWATYNGDHMSMYGVNAGVPKTLVKYLVKWIATHDSNESLCKTLLDIYDTPISPELLPADDKGNIAQKTEDLVGPYELHDFFIYNLIRNCYSPEKIFYLALKAFDGKYDSKTIEYWLRTFYRRFFNQQFKRSCMPDGPKVGNVSLSPRGDWRMPSDASSTDWLPDSFNL